MPVDGRTEPNTVEASNRWGVGGWEEWAPIPGTTNDGTAIGLPRQSHESYLGGDQAMTGFSHSLHEARSFTLASATSICFAQVQGMETPLLHGMSRAPGCCRA